MRKLLMVLFLFGTISVFCNAQIDGYYVKDSGNLALFADGEPRTSKFVLLNLLLEISCGKK